MMPTSVEEPNFEETGAKFSHQRRLCMGLSIVLC